MQPFTLRWLIPFTLVVLLLAACGDTADDSADTTLAPTTTTTTTTTEPTATTTTTTQAETTTTPADEPPILRDTVRDAEIVAPVAERDVCDLFSEEDVTAIVRDVYLTNGAPAAELPTLLVENQPGRGSTDSCDWLAAPAAWVILERIQDEEHKPHWTTGGFYQATPPGQIFEPNEAMPSGVEVDNVLVRRPYQDRTSIVGIDVQVVEDAPQWWRFNLWTDQDRVAEDLAFQVVSQLFETIQDNS